MSDDVKDVFVRPLEPPARVAWLESATKAELVEFLREYAPEQVPAKSVVKSLTRAALRQHALEHHAQAAARYAAALHRALADSALDPVEPDLDVPASGVTSSGWYANVYAKRVEPTWSTSSAHGHGVTRRKDYSASYGGIKLHSTKKLALRALREAIAYEAARVLAGLDQQIAAESDSEP